MKELNGRGESNALIRHQKYFSGGEFTETSVAHDGTLGSESNRCSLTTERLRRLGSALGGWKRCHVSLSEECMGLPMIAECSDVRRNLDSAHVWQAAIRGILITAIGLAS